MSLCGMGESERIVVSACSGILPGNPQLKEKQNLHARTNFFDQIVCENDQRFFDNSDFKETKSILGV